MAKQKIAKTIKNFTFVLSLALIGILIYSNQLVAAGGAKLYLSPSALSVNQNANFKIDLRVDTAGNETNALQAYLTYRTDKLSVTSITASDTFNLTIENSAGSGTIKISRAIFPPETVNGDQLIASINFKSLTTTGTSQVRFDQSNSHLIRASDNQDILSDIYGGDYSIKNAATAPPPSPPKDTVKPLIKNVRVEKLTASSAIISWQTSEPATSEVTYGLKTSYGLTVADDNLVTDHKLTLHSNLIRPETLYHYRIKSVDKAGNQSLSTDYTFKTLTAENTAGQTSDPQSQPAIFNSQPDSKRLLNPLMLSAGLASSVISLCLLLLGLERSNRISPIDKLLVSTLSPQHKQLLRDWLSK